MQLSCADAKIALKKIWIIFQSMRTWKNRAQMLLIIHNLTFLGSFFRAAHLARNWISILKIRPSHPPSVLSTLWFDPRFYSCRIFFWYLPIWTFTDPTKVGPFWLIQLEDLWAGPEKLVDVYKLCNPADSLIHDFQHAKMF